MRKYVVPIAALAGIALLTPSASAANLIIKSRAGIPGRPVSLPVSVNGLTSGTELWGIDFGLAYDTTKLGTTNDAGTGAAFTPETVGTETPVVVGGTPTVGTGLANPNYYIGYVRGTSGMPVATTTGAPNNGIGLIRMTVLAGAAQGQVVIITTPSYNVANDGSGSTTINRQGATGATSTATAGAAVNSEPVTLQDPYINGLSAPAGSNPDLRVPLHRVAVGRPGDVNGNGTAADAGDAANLSAIINLKPSSFAQWTEYKRIVSDVAPPNGYTAADIGGSAGQSYGDGVISAGDLSLMTAKLNNKPSAANFPVAE